MSYINSYNKKEETNMPVTTTITSQSDQNDLHIIELTSLFLDAKKSGGATLQTIIKDIKETITTCDQLNLFMLDISTEDKKYVIAHLGSDFLNNINSSEFKGFAIFKNEGLCLYIANILSQSALHKIFHDINTLKDLHHVPEAFEICELIGSEHIYSIFKICTKNQKDFQFSDFLSIFCENKRMAFVNFLGLDSLKKIIPDGKNLLFTLNILSLSDRQNFIRHFKKFLSVDDLFHYKDGMENYIRHEKLDANAPLSKIYVNFLSLTSHVKSIFFSVSTPTTTISEGKLEEDIHSERNPTLL